MTPPTEATVQLRRPTGPRPHPILVVLGWELRRMIQDKRTAGVIPGLLFVLFGLIVLARQSATTLNYGVVQIPGAAPLQLYVTITGTSAWGMSSTLPRLLLLVLGLFLPFVAGSLVAHDLQQRTHETLMTTAIPTGAYVMGRYLAGLVLCLGLAGVLLTAIVTVGLGLYVVGRAPAPALGPIAALWAVSVLPATVLVSGVSFALCTLWPRALTALRVVTLLGWFLCSFVVSLPQTLAQEIAAWDPTSSLLSQAVDGQYFQQFQPYLNSYLTQPQPSVDMAQIQAHQAQAVQAARLIEQQLPDLAPWVLPHLGLAAIGAAAVALTAHRFRRFREVL